MMTTFYDAEGADGIRDGVWGERDGEMEYCIGKEREVKYRKEGRDGEMIKEGERDET
jgi:hypothetical protein